MEPSNDIVLVPLPRSSAARAGSSATPGAPPEPASVGRVVGPGRRERAYQERVAALDGELQMARGEARLFADRVESRERELALAERIERGSQRRLDKLETRLESADQVKARLILALGAVQRENEDLRAALAGARTPPARLASRAPAGWFARLFQART